MKNLLDYVLKIDNFLDPKICTDITSKLQYNNFLPHYYNIDNTKSSVHYNETELFVTSNSRISEVIDNKIPYALFKYKIKVCNRFWDPTSRNKQNWSEIRYNKYSSNQKMNEHIDHIHSLFDGNRRGIPILSLLGLLNNDYDGGNFFLCNEKIDLKMGDLLIFPSNFLYPHRVDPILNGIRYSYITWLW